MTRGTIRTVLRRNIKDPETGGEFSNAELNDIINLGYSLVQKEVRKFYPEAHLTWDYINTEVGENWYPLPPTFSVTHVGYKASATDTVWTVLGPPKAYRDLAGLVTTGSTTYYTRRGQWIGIFPAPTEAVTDGIEIVHNSIHSMSADGETPRVKVPLHLAILYWAKLIALGETDANAGETRQRLDEILGDIASWYDIHSDAPDRFAVEL